MPPTIETTAMRNVTPIVTPSSVKKLFSFWTRICPRARRTASKYDTGRSAGERGLGHAVLGDEPLSAVVARDPAIADDDDAPGVRSNVRLVRHHNHRLSLVGEGLEHLHDLSRGGRIEVFG